MPGFLFLWRYHWHARTPKKKSHHLTNSAARGRWRTTADIYGSLYESRVTKKKEEEEERNDPFSWRVGLPLIETSSTMRSDYFSRPPLLCRMIERMTGRESPVIRSDFSNRRLICDRIYSSGEHVNRLPRNPPESSSERFHVQPQSL